MAWSNQEKPSYRYRDYEVGVHIQGSTDGLQNIGEEGLVARFNTGVEEHIDFILQSARTERDRMIDEGHGAYLKSPNPEIFEKYDDVAQQQRPGNFKKTLNRLVC